MVLSKKIPTIKKMSAVTAVFLFPVLVNAQIEYELDSYLPFDSAEDLVVAILRIFITIATPIIVLFIIYAGFKYVTAQGNAQQVQEATRALTYAIVGAVLIIGAVAISEIIANTVGAFQQ
jgi:hypothetical protein